MRNPQRADEGRSAFLAAARGMAQSAPPRPAAPHPAILRWRPAFALSVLTVLLLMVLASAGATLAAQSSLPGEALYGLKLWSEETRLSLTGDPWAAWQLSLDFTQRRVDEALALGGADHPLPADLPARLLAQADHSIRLVLALAVEAQEQARLLQQTRARLASMVEQLEGYLAQPEAHQIGALKQLRLELQERVNWIDDGMQDPDRLREQLGLGPQGIQPATTHTPTPCPTCTPEAAGQRRATESAGTPTRQQGATGTPDPKGLGTPVRSGGTHTPGPNPTGGSGGPNPTSGFSKPQSTPQPGPTGQPSGPNPTSGSGKPSGPNPTSGSGGPQSTPQPDPTGQPGKP